MKESPYFVEPSKIPKEAINLAIKRGLFKKCDVDEKLVDDYLKSKENIPIWIVELACNINKNYIEIPIQYQYLWFCLNRTKVRRITPSGKIWNPKVNFNPVYIKADKRILNLIQVCLKKYSKTKLAELCGLKKGWSITLWQENKERIPLNALLKICQLLKKDIWNIIDGYKIYSKTNYNNISYKNVLPKRDLLNILIWLKTEGNISIFKQFIEIKQDVGGLNLLEDLSKVFQESFKINKKGIHLIRSSQYPNMWGLRINSATLRYILTMKYNIPLGYKSPFLSLEQEIRMATSTEDKYFGLAKLWETEGSFYFNKGTTSKFPVTHISTSSKKVAIQIANLLRKMGYKSIIGIDRNKRHLNRNVGYFVSIKTKNDVIKFCYFIFPYFNHARKITKFMQLIREGNFGKNVRVDNAKSIKELIDKARNMGNRRSKNRALSNYLNSKLNQIKINQDTIQNWISGSRPPILVLYFICKLVKEDVEVYIPKFFNLIYYTESLINIENLEKIRENKIEVLRRL